MLSEPSNADTRLRDVSVIWRMPQGSRRRPWKVSKTMQLKLFYERSKGAEGDLGNLNIIIAIEISSSFCYNM